MSNMENSVVIGNPGYEPVSHDECDFVLQEHMPVMEAHFEAVGEGMGFEVLRHVQSQDMDSRPLLVWVHPGDACESDAPEARIRKRAKTLQEGMAREIQERMSTHRVLVLHRESSLFAFEPWVWDRVSDTYSMAMADCLKQEQVGLLWGDDLEAASQWILEHKQGAQEVFLTGAWRHPEWGCVTAVGKALIAGGLQVEVSRHSPSEPGIIQGGWEPPGPSRRRRMAP